MPNTKEEEVHNRFATILNSNLVVGFARIAMPLVLAIIGWLAAQVIKDLGDKVDKLYLVQTSVWSAVGELNRSIAATSASVAVLNNQVTTDHQEIADHEARVRALERTIR